MATDVYAEQEVITFDLDGGAVESPDEFYSGNRVSREGYFHFACDGIERKQEEGKLDHLQIDLRVLDGNDMDGKRLEDQIDKTLVHRLYLERWVSKPTKDDPVGEKGPLEEKALKGLRAFAYAFGLISEEQLAQPNVRIPFHQIAGRQAVGKVQREDDWADSDGNQKKGQLKVSWNNDFWPVNHERVKDVSKDREALALLGITGGASGGATDSDLADI